MSNSDRFLAAFNRIEARLRDETGSGREIGFVAMVRLSRSAIVRRYDQDLREYAELRNAIVHDRLGKVLAEPNAAAVEDIEHIATVFTAPPKIDQVIARRTVTTTSPSAPISVPILAMRRGDFSQVPVYREDAFEALLTAETVSRWVADSLERDGGILDEALVSDVLTHAETRDNYALVGPSATVYEALDLFDQFRRKGRTLDAIIVAHDARQDVKPLNIVTIYDVPALVDAS